MRSREEAIRDFVRQWLRKAEQDLSAAKTLLGVEADDYFPCAFHCQQAAEKFLKAFLVRVQIEFRKTHNLDELLTLTDTVDRSIRSEVGACVWLTRYGVEYRYPGEYPAVDRNTAKQAYTEAEQVKQAVTKRV